MKRAFRFPLDRLLRLRAAEEDLARADLLRARTALNEAEEFRDRLRASLDRTRAERATLRSQGPFNSHLDELSGELERQLEIRIAGQATRIAAAEKVVEEALAAHAERRQDREALDRLSNLARERHTKEVAAADQAEADEASATRHARIHSTGPSRSREKGPEGDGLDLG